MHTVKALSSFSTLRIFLLLLTLLLPSAVSFAQSGKSALPGRRTETLNVIVHAPKDKEVVKDDFDLYDSGIPQEVETFARIDAGSRIILMVDSSISLKADNDQLQSAVLALINELYQDDEMMLVDYNEAAEIIEDMTPDLAKLQTAAAKLDRKGFPSLYDALIAVSDAFAHQAKTGIEKRAIILISDGYDSGSKTKFEDSLHALQEGNIVLYAIQVKDRTRGALQRDKPKPPAALEQLTTGTGGSIHQIDDIAEAAKLIADDLRKNWYRLVYSPSGVNPINTRRLLLMSRSDSVKLRTKGSHPGIYR
ncbi:MAG: VWA domain-containing protein [Blastocatellia bacterium]|nr:VWA domain-containing protein [Blastocatellia bacterium]